MARKEKKVSLQLAHNLRHCYHMHIYEKMI